MADLGPSRHLGFSNISGLNIQLSETAVTVIHVNCLAEILQIQLLSTQVVIVTGSMHQERQDLCIFMQIQLLIQEQLKLNRERKTTLAHRMDSLGEQMLQLNRHYIKTITEVILLCARRDIALRGHDESENSENPGNFKAILHLIANHDDQFQQSYRNAPRNALYTSPDIQNHYSPMYPL